MKIASGLSSNLMKRYVIVVNLHRGPTRSGASILGTSLIGVCIAFLGLWRCYRHLFDALTQRKFALEMLSRNKIIPTYSMLSDGPHRCRAALSRLPFIFPACLVPWLFRCYHHSNPHQICLLTTDHDRLALLSPSLVLPCLSPLL